MQNLLAAVLGAGITIMSAGMPWAGADGPDYFRVVGVASNDVLNIRAEASATSTKLGAIPYDGDSINNLGCTGGLTFAQWSQASDAERKAAELLRWCRISYQGVQGWAAGRYLGEGSAPDQDALAPSFDCSKAAGQAEEAICSTPRLARLDRELVRLYRLAVDGPNMSADRLDLLKAMQRGWIKGRNECWKSGDELNACIVFTTVMRIDEIRTGYFDARRDDGSGISTGPFAYDCQGLGAGLSVTFVATDPALASLSWRDYRIVPEAVTSGSGRNFVARTADGTYEFQITGQQARFSLPDGSTLACRQDEIG